MWGRLQALPPYLGSKRRLLGQIFKYLPSVSEAPVFVDAFLGGGLCGEVVEAVKSLKEDSGEAVTVTAAQTGNPQNLATPN